MQQQHVANYNHHRPDQLYTSLRKLLHANGARVGPDLTPQPQALPYRPHGVQCIRLYITANYYMPTRSLTAAYEVAPVGGEVAEVEYHSPVSSALLGRAPRREQRVKKDDSTQR